MKKNKRFDLLEEIITRYEMYSDIFSDVSINSIGIKETLKNYLSENNIYFIKDLFDENVKNKLIKPEFNRFFPYFLKSLKKYFYDHFFGDFIDLNLFVRIDKMIALLSLLDNNYLNYPIIKFKNISSRLAHCFKRSEIVSFYDLISYNSSSLIKINNFGMKSMEETCELIEDFIVCSKRADNLDNISPINRKLEINITGMCAFDSMLKLLSDNALDSVIAEDVNDVRLINCLNKSKIIIYRDLLSYSIEDLLRIPQFGKKCFKILKNTISQKLDLDNDNKVETECYFNKLLKKINFQSEHITDFSDLFFDDSFREVHSCLVQIINDNDFNLTKRQKEILNKRFNNFKIITLEEIATSYSLTRERIRQILDKTYKKLVFYFAKQDSKYNNDVDTFFSKIYEVKSNKIVSCLYFLLSNDDLISKILKTCLINKIDDKLKKILLSKNFKGYFTKTNSSLELIFGRENKFLLGLQNVDGLKEYNSDLIQKIKSDVIPDIDVQKFVSKMRINNETRIKIFYYPLIEEFYCDFALVVENKYLILVNIFPNLPSMINEQSLKRYNDFSKYCIEQGFSFAWFTPNFESVHSLSIMPVTRKRCLDILEKIKKASEQQLFYNKFVTAFKVNEVLLAAVCLQNKIPIKTNPFRIVPEAIETCEEFDEFEKIKLHDFSIIEKKFFLGFLELEKIYCSNLKKSNENKKIYFGVLRVFYTGYENSHIYEFVKGCEYFGCGKKMNSSEIKRIVESLVKLKLINEKMTRYGKTYYASNGKIIAASRILNRLLGINDSFDDYYLESDYEFDEMEGEI